MIYIERSKLNIAGMWLIPLDRVTYTFRWVPCASNCCIWYQTIFITLLSYFFACFPSRCNRPREDKPEVDKSRSKRVNYEDPHFNVKIPIFSIHGNHDNPSGVSKKCIKLATLCRKCEFEFGVHLWRFIVIINRFYENFFKLFGKCVIWLE